MREIYRGCAGGELRDTVIGMGGGGAGGGGGGAGGEKSEKERRLCVEVLSADTGCAGNSTIRLC